MFYGSVLFQSAFIMFFGILESSVIVCAVFIWTIKGNSANFRHDIAEETQHAICNISTKDVQTSANASVTRKLKGVCTSRQLDLRFKELESKLLKELQSIRKILLQSDGGKIIDTGNPYPTVASPENSFSTLSTKTLNEEEYSEEALPIFSSFKTTRFNYKNVVDEEPVFFPEQSNAQKDEEMFAFDNKKLEIQSDWTKPEVRMAKLNNTIKKGTKNIYYYFWKVENFNKLITRSDVYVASPTFMVLGHDLFIQIFPNQPKKNFVTIKMRGHKSFVKNHKFSILRRTATGENINSPLLGFDLRSNNVFPVPLKSIRNYECLKEDNIIIELNIFL